MACSLLPFGGNLHNEHGVALDKLNLGNSKFLRWLVMIERTPRKHRCGTAVRSSGNTCLILSACVSTPQMRALGR